VRSYLGGVRALVVRPGLLEPWFDNLADRCTQGNLGGCILWFLNDERYAVDSKHGSTIHDRLST